MKLIGFPLNRNLSYLALLIVAIFLIMIFVQISYSQDSTEKYWIDPEDMPTYEQQYLQSIAPKPVDPSLGPINYNGRVILYGQLLEPPFQLAIIGDSLFLNGVRIEPALRPPWRVYTKPFEITECSRLQSRTINRIDTLFNQYIEENKSNIHEMILNDIKREFPEVRSARWSSGFGQSAQLLITWNCDSLPIGIMLPSIELPSKEQMEKNYRQSLKGKMKSVSSSLSVGGLVCLGYDGTSYLSSRIADSVWTTTKDALGSQSYDILEKVIRNNEHVKEIIYFQKNK
jgi:hypothetical protein